MKRTVYLSYDEKINTRHDHTITVFQPKSVWECIEDSPENYQTEPIETDSLSIVYIVYYTYSHDDRISSSTGNWKIFQSFPTMEEALTVANDAKFLLEEKCKADYKELESINIYSGFIREKQKWNLDSTINVWRVEDKFSSL